LKASVFAQIVLVYIFGMILKNQQRFFLCQWD